MVPANTFTWRQRPHATMDRTDDVTRNRWLLIAIGAGTMVLALLVFSGICWGTLMACGVIVVHMEFWEVLAISGLTAGLLLMLRALVRNLRRSRSLNARLAHTPGAAALTHPTEPISTPAPEPTEPPVDCDDSTGWRALYDQLSDEERKEFKALMAKFCGCSDSGAQAGAQPGTDRPRHNGGTAEHTA